MCRAGARQGVGDQVKSCKILQTCLQILQNIGEILGFLQKFLEFSILSEIFLQNFENSASSFCRSRKMLQNEYLVAKIGVDAAENGPRKE